MTYNQMIINNGKLVCYVGFENLPVVEFKDKFYEQSKTSLEMVPFRLREVPKLYGFPIPDIDD